MQEKKKKDEQLEVINLPEKPVCDEWATQALEEMDEFIESQGIYIRQ